MNAWRFGLTAVGLLLLGGPLCLTIFDLFANPASFGVWQESDRLSDLARQTLLLTGGTIFLTVPAGTLLALLLYRSDLPGREIWRFCIFVTLFIPLPLFTSAWQAMLGPRGLLPISLWSDFGAPATGGYDPSRPWTLGLPAAIWVHAMAGLPWVVLIVGQGLSWVERSLEEDASLAAPAWLVFVRVTLVRSRAAIAASALWIAVMTGTEITITDMMQVRTFAEEIYTQIVLGDAMAVSRATAVALPTALFLAGLVLILARTWQRHLPPLEDMQAMTDLLRLGSSRWPISVLVCALVGLLLAVPMISLLWKAGLSGAPPHWVAQVAWGHVRTAFTVRGRMVMESLLQAMASGAATAVLAMVFCWLAVESRWLRMVLLGLMALIWAWPAPLLGLGLKGTIKMILDLVPLYPLEEALYYGPSPLPVVWAHLIRFFPCAVAILWPIVRLLPVELRESARAEGAQPAQELRLIVWPLSRTAGIRAGLAVAVLSLGELGAGKIVETPGGQNFAHEVFTQMHYGVTNDLAALCLLLLAMILPGAAILWFQSRNSSRGSRIGSSASALRATASVNSM